jgi:hypothetical protein
MGYIFMTLCALFSFTNTTITAMCLVVFMWQAFSICVTVNQIFVRMTSQYEQCVQNHIEFLCHYIKFWSLTFISRNGF